MVFFLGMELQELIVHIAHNRESREAVRRLIFNHDLHKWGLPLQNKEVMLASENFISHNVSKFCVRNFIVIQTRGGLFPHILCYEF